MGLKTRLFNLEELEELTGKNPRTIKKRLDGLDPEKIQGKAILYDAQKALPLIFMEVKRKNAADGSLADENIRQTRLKSELLEVKLERERGLALPVEMVDFAWSQVLSSFRARLLSLATKISPRLVGLEQKEIQKVIDLECRDACEELSKLDAASITQGLNHEDSDDPEATAETDS